MPKINVRTYVVAYIIETKGKVLFLYYISTAATYMASVLNL
jgi:hypothetical protein